MNAKLLLLPSMALTGAALLFAPLASTRAFTKSGQSLDLTQRDVRVFNNFADPTANDNTTPDSQFPGRTGAELAVWKGIVEWGSLLHGDGSGDPLAGNKLGSGGADFDALWAGSATEVGGINDNIISAVSSCSALEVGYLELPIGDGWRMRFCDTMTFEDGPGAIGSGHFDIQSLACSLYGWALGLGNSSDPEASAYPFIDPGETKKRSIAPDDIAGVQCIYGLASPTKPRITGTSASGGTLTIVGRNFDPASNEVWFTSAAATAAAVDPIVRVGGVASTGGTQISVPIPAGAGPGDVMVHVPGTGNATLSNAFPTDLVGSFGGSFGISSVTPAAIEALIPGTEQTITISGVALDFTASLALDGVSIAGSHYTIVDPSTITLDMPLVPTLGAHVLSATDGVLTSNFPVTIVPPTRPRLELGTGDLFNVVDRDNGLPFIVAGTPGTKHRLYGSLSSVPSINAYVSLSIGNHFTDLFYGGQFTIPASGWLPVFVPTAALPDPGASGTVFYAQTVELTFPAPLQTSPRQSITLVR